MNVFVVTGQTATGKTNLALKLAEKHNGQLINCDSRQVYQYLNIVTGKDKPKDHKILLYDIIDPKEYFSSFDWVQQAIILIKKLLKQKKTPIIVGGTYLYLYHLLYKIDTEKVLPNWPLRKKLSTKTVSELQEILVKLNIQSSERLNNSDKNNPQRLIRKIEILTSGKDIASGLIPPAGWNLADKINLPQLKIKFLALKFKKKEDLTRAIKKRVEQRINQGAVDEVKTLLKKGYSENDPGLKTIGYQQIIQYLKGKISKQEATNQWINKEVQYAKRQLTFMKKDKNIRWKYV